MAAIPIATTIKLTNKGIPEEEEKSVMPLDCPEFNPEDAGNRVVAVSLSVGAIVGSERLKGERVAGVGR